VLRYQYEIDEELEALRTLKDEAEGNEERVDCIEAQITTIKDGLKRQAVEELYEDDPAAMEAAVVAHRWYWEDDEASSRVWQSEEYAQAA